MMARNLYREMREAVVAFLFEENGGCCYLCGDYMYDDDLLDIDHIEPVSQGGGNTLDNFALTHQSCNRSQRREPFMRWP